MDVYAQLNLADESVNPMAKIQNLGVLFNVIIPIMTAVIGFSFFIMLVYGGFTYLTSGDNAEGVKKATATMTSAIIGLVIVLCAYLLVKLIDYFFHIQLPI